MDISVRKYGSVHVIELRGDLKIGESVDGFRQAIEQLFDAGDNQIVVDVGAVPMIDSSGIGVLVRSLTSAKQRGGALKLVKPSKLAVQTLKIVGLINLFEVFDDQTPAVESFG
ncbi:MAG: STAS domain-containing protein [Acidobacteriota bacterium]|nr:STAS domain-containing protein [Acidobacteriota bacterium]